ncbi:MULTISPECIES: DUF3329 domain-containing protein [Enterococcus]|nr:DUF6056 family protein [Enterococcus faecalis]EGO2675753.1 hypothetical protein [Enterococcus faecalis]EGO2720319.1 hypothetical protein [Enterococcus faecalis]EGO5117201.1 hypothetical protein [Enterococcus faecalis]EGO5239764.1 hypothetical protein [Enterococcus faecalis]EGO6140375.1 hypothetical protein [Enterococcus faecalis]
MKVINSKKFFFSVCFLIYIILVILNFLTPLIADDFAYIYKTEGFHTILHDEYLQYITQNGRSVAHILVRIFLLLPKFIFNFLNPLVFLMISYLIYIMTNFSSQKWNTVRFLLIMILIFLFIPQFGETILWETGSFNYLWTFGIMLLFVSKFHFTVINNDKRESNWQIVYMFFLGIVAGWCNENTSAGIILIASGYMLVYKFINRAKIEKWMKTGVLGLVIGFIMMMSSPGNKIRSSWFERSTWSLPKKLLYGLKDVSNTMVEHADILLMLTILTIVFCIFLYKTKYNYLFGIVYLFAGGAVCYSLALSPAGYTWGRSFFGGIMFIIMALMMCLPTFEDQENSKIINPIFTTIYIMLLFSSFFTSTIAMYDIFHSYSEVTMRYKVIEKEKERGNLNPVVPDFNFQPKTGYPAYSNKLSHINEDINYKYNVYTADYFGVNSVRTVPMTVWQEKHKK